MTRTEANGRVTVSQVTKVTYTYNNLFVLPVVIEVDVEEAAWTCQFGHRLYSGDGTEALVILREIVARLQAELAEAATAIDVYQKALKESQFDV